MYGRYGDTQVRNVGGEPSHVNDTEAHWIDNYGLLGEVATQSMGSGTTNPKTGMKEYFWPQVAGLALQFGGPLLAQHLDKGKNQPTLEGNMAPWKDTLDKQSKLGSSFIDPNSQENLDEATRIRNLSKDSASFTNMINNRNVMQGGVGGYSGILGQQRESKLAGMNAQTQSMVEEMLRKRRSEGMGMMGEAGKGYQQYGAYQTERDLASMPINMGDAMGGMGAGLLDYLMKSGSVPGEVT